MSLPHRLMDQQISMNPIHPRHKLLFLTIGLPLALLLTSPWALAESLRTQLETLAQENHIQIEGLDRIGVEAAMPIEGDLEQRLKALLADYNFLSVGAGKKIEKLTILSAKSGGPKPQISGTVKTQKLGSHHQVPVVLTGPNNREIPSRMLVDTGATTLVLPISMIGRLGFTAGSLRDAMSQTAGGTIPIKTGVLKWVKVGDVIADDVPVSFIADAKLNGASLLGMSYLSRFRFSLDDATNELILLAK